MLPIHRLLSRIRWDPRFGAGEFMLGYCDRIARRTILVPLREARFPPDNRRVFEIMDAAAGTSVVMPYCSSPRGSSSSFPGCGFSSSSGGARSSRSGLVQSTPRMSVSV